MKYQESIINLQELNKLCKGNVDKELKYMRLFTELIPLNIHKLKLSIEKEDRDMVMKEIHFMSPHLLFFGINDLTKFLEINEDLSFDSLKKQINNCIIKIEKAIIIVENLIEVKLNNYNR